MIGYARFLVDSGKVSKTIDQNGICFFKRVNMNFISLYRMCAYAPNNEFMYITIKISVPPWAAPCLAQQARGTARARPGQSLAREPTLFCSACSQPQSQQ